MKTTNTIIEYVVCLHKSGYLLLCACTFTVCAYTHTCLPVMWVTCHDRGRTLSSGMFCRALFLNLPIVSVKGSQGDDIMQQAVFEVPVLKEPLIAIRISLNKRLRNIGWFLAFASRSCLLTSEVWSPIIIYPPAPHSWQLSPWRGLNAGATHWLHQSVRNCNIKNNNWYSGGRLLFEYFL